MNFDIKGKPDFSMVDINLDAGEQIKAESGSMVSMSDSISIETGTKGGIIKGLKRSILGGESFFMNSYKAESTSGTISLAPKTPGDIHHLSLNGENFYLQSGSYLASSENIDADSKWGGARLFFGGEGLFMLQCSGSGELWFSSFGAIHEVDVNGSFIADTGSIVGFEQTLDYSVKSVGGIKSLLFSGEGLVCEFSGFGKLYLQTRQPAGFISWIDPFRKVKSNDS